MSKQYSGREQLTGRLWLILIPPSIWFLYWLFSSDKKETPSGLDYVSTAPSVRYDTQSKLDISILKKEIKAEMLVAGIPTYDVQKIDESPCLLMYTNDSGSERDGLALTICSSAQRFNVKCVSIRDMKDNTLGQSICN